MSAPRYVFIVGMARTGTTLLRNVLNRSDEVGMGGESRFLVAPRLLSLHRERGFRDELREVGDLTTDSGARRVVDHIYRIRKDNFWGKIAKGADRDEFLQHLLNSDRSERALLDLALAFHARGKPIRGEKTPAHIEVVPQILEWFPNARIVHMIRDPRATFVSKQHKDGDRPSVLAPLRERAESLYELYASVRTIERWRHVISLHHRYRTQFAGRYHLLRFEDLVTDPRTSINEVCRFIGIEFTEKMLDQTVTNSSFVQGAPVGGFNAKAIERWRGILSPALQRWFRLWCGRSLREFGYRP